MPEIVWRGIAPNVSVPNCYIGRWAAGIKQPIISIVNHIMEGSLAGTDAYFRNPNSQASTHYGVGKGGLIYQWVRDEDTAWGNGTRYYTQVTPNWLKNYPYNPNNVTISIEHEGYTGDVLPEAQYQASLWLQKLVIKRYNLPVSRDKIIGHYQVDNLSRPNCPGTGFPFDRLMADLTAWDNAGRPDGAVTEDVIKNPVNSFVVRGGFKDRYLEMSQGDLQKAVRNIGYPRSNEVMCTDGVVRQVFDGLVFEYYPPETFPNRDGFWVITRSLAGVSWYNANMKLFPVGSVIL